MGTRRWPSCCRDDLIRFSVQDYEENPVTSVVMWLGKPSKMEGKGQLNAHYSKVFPQQLRQFRVELSKSRVKFGHLAFQLDESFGEQERNHCQNFVG